MQSDLIDGGAIYVLGVGTSTSTISGNYIVDDPKPYGAIYLDGSSSLWEVTGNVVSKAKTNWMFLQDLPEQAARSNVVKDNETDTTQQRLGITGLNTLLGQCHRGGLLVRPRPTDDRRCRTLMHTRWGRPISRSVGP